MNGDSAARNGTSTPGQNRAITRTSTVASTAQPSSTRVSVSPANPQSVG